MLRISSFKAFVISNLLQFILSFAIGSAATSFLWRHAGGHLPPNVSPFDTVAMLPMCFSVILSSLIAGFIAACMAEYRPVLHGAFSSCFWLILTLYPAWVTFSHGVQSRELFATLLSLIVALAALLAGALGGYGAAQLGSASRYDLAPVSRTGFVEGGLVAKLLLSLVVTASICTFIFFSPTIFCHGEGAGGNCGEGYMASIPIAILLSPFIFAGMVFLV
jgi:hypothetical protein